MIQFNLLPDVKLEYLKAQRQRRTVAFISMIVTAASVALLVLMFLAGQVQKGKLADLTKNVANKSLSLQNKNHLNQALTVQNQLNSLTGLHDSKPAADRLFPYLNKLTPLNADISILDIDFTAHTVTLKGTADALSTVNKYVDTLKFTTYKVGKETKPAFSNVVLSLFDLNKLEASNKHPANYTINFSYDEAIFNITNNFELTVPELTSTRSQLTEDQVNKLFNGQATPSPATPKTSGGIR
jgi:Tfp pilus assembly protein PilN